MNPPNGPESCSGRVGIPLVHEGEEVNLGTLVLRVDPRRVATLSSDQR